MSESKAVEGETKLEGLAGGRTREEKTKGIFWWNRYGSSQEGIVLGRKNIYHYVQKYEIQWNWKGNAWRKEKISREEALRIIEANKEKVNKEELEKFLKTLGEQ